MVQTLHTLYPGLLAAIDLGIAGGLLFLKGVSPLGFLMAAVGVLLVCHVVFNAASRTNTAVHRFADGL